MTADAIIRKLNLVHLDIEGGFFRETYRSNIKAFSETPRSAGTCIYYMLTEKDISDWHKVASDEIWLYHAGSPAVQLLLFPDGRWEERIIGPDVLSGQVPQSLIPANTWQAAVLMNRDKDDWGLFGALVVPGFEYSDFTLGKRDELSVKYPDAAAKIKSLW